MGALSNNRKRADEYFSLSSSLVAINSPKYSHQIDLQISKRARTSHVQQTSDVKVSSSKSTALRVYRYPEAKPQFRREVHAPCRVRKFGFLSSSSSREFKGRSSGLREKEETNIMGNIVSNTSDILASKYEQSKKGAFSALSYSSKAEGVIVVEAGKKEHVISEDSSIEEIENLEDGREGGSVISDHRLQETDVLGAGLQKSERKDVENGVIPASSSVVSDVTEVEHAGKMLVSLSLHDEVSVDNMPAYKSLLESPGIKNRRLSELEFQIKLHNEKLALLALQRVKKPEVKLDEDVLREAFALLTEEEEEEVARAFSYSFRRRVLVTHEDSNIQITGQVLQCLMPCAWLNDEVINLFLVLLKERERRDPKRFLKCHFFNTFFYKKLIGGKNGYDYKSVRRWTTQKKLGYGLLECDKIFVPIHKEIHWCLAVINKKDEKFQYLDSLGGRDTKVMNVLARYYVDEVKDKSAQDIDVSSWEHEYVEDLPVQENGFDCGVFMIKYADFYSRGLGLQFSQDNMPYFRLRTAKEILRLRAD
ncbi:hypothetical protein Ancab_030588 [Ancistrocladus abbreviatus]